MSAVSLALAKQACDVDYAAQDDFIQSLIDGAEDWVERHCGVKLTSAAAVEYVDGGGFALWPRSRRPVTAVSEVYDNEADSAEDADDYVLRGNRIVRDDDAQWAAGPEGRWRVTYTGGYAAVPAGLKSVLLDLVARGFDARGGKTSQGAAGYGVQWGDLLDSGMLRKLEAYRVASARLG